MKMIFSMMIRFSECAISETYIIRCSLTSTIEWYMLFHDWWNFWYIRISKNSEISLSQNVSCDDSLYNVCQSWKLLDFHAPARWALSNDKCLKAHEKNSRLKFLRILHGCSGITPSRANPVTTGTFYESHIMRLSSTNCIRWCMTYQD